MPSLHEGADDTRPGTTAILNRLRRIFSKTPARETPPDFTATYTDPAGQFSFKHPPMLRIETSAEGAGTMIRARNTARTIGFQLSIRPISAEAPMTPADDWVWNNPGCWNNP